MTFAQSTKFLEDKKGKQNTSYNGSGCKRGMASDLVLSVCVLSSWRTSSCRVPDSFSQAATNGPRDSYLPILHFASSNGAPRPVRSASIAGLRVASPTTLLCFPHPVKMLHKQSYDCQLTDPKQKQCYASSFSRLLLENLLLDNEQVFGPRSVF